ncbi:MAG: PorV/PorQ family protein [Elusimicrobia bacterium]|nr:PorV/PorQ family protein [Elusimicrobiota bacterium]
MKRTAAAIGVALAAFAAGGRALAASPGAEPFDFLSLDAGARAVAMGGAQAALASDAEALIYNPAALGRGGRYEATLMHNQYVSPITQEYVGFATPQGLGLQLNYLTYGHVPRTTVSNPDGTGASFGITDTALGLGLGREVAEGLRVGGAVKFIRESIDNVSGSAYAADGGILYATPGRRRWLFAAALQNMGSTVRFQSANEKLPAQLRLGAAYEVRSGAEAPASFDWVDNLLALPVTFELDLIKERSDNALFSFGAESWLAPSFAARVGFNGRNDAGIGITAGFGWRHDGFQLDYAFTPLGDLGSAHRLSATFRWGGAKAPAVPVRVPERDLAGLSVDERIEKHLNAAEEFLRLGMFAQAQDELGEATALLVPTDPREIRRLSLLGGLRLQQKDFSAARVAFMDSLTMAIKSGLRDRYVADAYAGMGFCLLEEKNTGYAVKFFRRALEGNPSPETARSAQKELRKLGGAD